VDANGCWLWQGYTDKDGYGRLGSQGLAHRQAYVTWRGQHAPGLELDHLCRVKRCCNPDHLEPVTHKVNMERCDRSTWRVTKHGGGWHGRNQQTDKTHCPQGHPYDEQNTYRPPARPTHRHCRACMKRHSQEYKARRAAQ